MSKLYGHIKLDPPMNTPAELPLLKDAPRETFGVTIGPSTVDGNWNVYINRHGDVIFLEDLDVFKFEGDRLEKSTFRFKAVHVGTKISADWIA